MGDMNSWPMLRLAGNTFFTGATIFLVPTVSWLTRESFEFSGNNPMFAELPPYEPGLIVFRYPGWAMLPCVPVGALIMVTAWGLHRRRDWARRFLAMFALLGVAACVGIIGLLIVATFQLHQGMVITFHLAGIALLIVSVIALLRLRKDLQSGATRDVFIG